MSSSDLYMKARVCVNDELLESISVESGVKQDDLLAPTIFAIFFAIVILQAFAHSNANIYIYKTDVCLSICVCVLFIHIHIS